MAAPPYSPKLNLLAHGRHGADGDRSAVVEHARRDHLATEPFPGGVRSGGWLTSRWISAKPTTRDSIFFVSSTVTFLSISAAGEPSLETKQSSTTSPGRFQRML